MAGVNISPPETLKADGRNNGKAWDVWKNDCAALVPDDDQIYPPGFQINYDNYAGKFLIRLAGIAYFVQVEDNGWHPTGVTEVDDDGTVVKEAPGINNISTTVINLATGQQTEYQEDIEDQNIPGVAYAVTRALEEREDPTNGGHYWRYIRGTFAAYTRLNKDEVLD